MQKFSGLNIFHDTSRSDIINSIFKNALNYDVFLTMSPLLPFSFFFSLSFFSSPSFQSSSVSMCLKYHSQEILI